ncbi:MAG: penicillin acylase family protein, partial [Rubricoccaceae bacterium]|nr:penicillin acylase family protein [Rubricoccaceae bacterium]
MSRLFSALGLLVLIVAVLAAVVGYFAYGTEPARSGTLDVPGLRGPVAVSWADGGVVVEGTEAADLAAALGYVHGVDDAWALALWRQAALGSLSQWFADPAAVALDRHARALGLGSLARLTYSALPDSNRALLDAYAAGVNRALADPAVAQRDEFVLLDLAPDPFEPWHALAVERLFAWAGTPPLRLDGAATSDSALARFARTDSLYRAFLHLGGASQSRAWVAPLDAAGGVALVQQHAYGASALPLVREVTLRRGGRSVVAATVPGTLVFPGGADDRGAWSVFLTSPATLETTAEALPPLAYDRLVDRAGNETLLAIRRGEGGLFFETDTGRAGAARPDTLAPAGLLADSLGASSAALPVWALRWPGFAPGTDSPAWWALLEGRRPGFELFRGEGLRMTRDGDAVVLGDPRLQRALPGGVFVSADSLAGFAAERLASLLDGADSLAVPLRPAALASDALSPWAAERLPGLLAALGNRDSLAFDLKDPYAYLLSWDARYTPEAIGASLFETWLQAHEEALGEPPVPGDSVDRPVLQQTLRLAVAIL